MADKTVPEAWVTLPTTEQLMAAISLDDPDHSYLRYGFLPAMGRLAMAHGRIGAAFLSLATEVFYRSERLARDECEMIAAVAAAAQDCHY